VIQTEDPRALREQCETWRKEGLVVGVVPTMGFLHEGHLSLMRIARQRADRVVVTLFVNPSQFGPNEDLDSYPRDLDGDVAKCRAEQVSLLFCPPVSAMYPAGHQSFVDVGQIGEGLCGGRRPGHFRGVCTVVSKLFNLVGACCAVFGEKDYQQLQVIKQFTRDLNFPVEIIPGPIVREPDGLAMSSRNAYLSSEQRVAARCLSRALRQAAAMLEDGPLEGERLLEKARDVIAKEPLARLDYIELRARETLAPVTIAEPGQVVMLGAVFVGTTRLIDNFAF
jgi:pantoate--beta-alanine ligase